MTDTRMVRLEQIAINPIAIDDWKVGRLYGPVIAAIKSGYKQTINLRCKQIADAAGGDVFQPIGFADSSMAEALRRAKWPHLVQVEIINSTEGTVK